MRRFLRELSLFAVVIAACTVALLHALGLGGPGSRPVLPVATVQRLAPTALAESMDILRHASRFEASAVGYAGTVPSSVVAWLTIARSPGADSLFHEVFRTSTPAGQLYALAGLRTTNPRSFDDAARWLRDMPVNVPTLAGCIGGLEPMRSLVDDLKRGAWVTDFLAADAMRYHGTLPWPQN